MALGQSVPMTTPRDINHASHRGAPPPATISSPQSAASPPSKRELASWWKKFRKNNDKSDEKGQQKPFFQACFPTTRTVVIRGLVISHSGYCGTRLEGQRFHANNFTVDTSPGIFGVPLAESILYANVAISLTNEQGESFIYGYVPIVVAKCGVFLKEKGGLVLHIA